MEKKAEGEPLNYGGILYGLLSHICLHEQLQGKYPELMSQLEEVIRKEYAHPETKEMLKQLMVKAEQTIEEFEKLLFAPRLPETEKKYSDVLKEILQVAQTATPTPLTKSPRALRVRIFLEGCWDLMHSGHFNAIRQVGPALES